MHGPRMILAGVCLSACSYTSGQTFDMIGVGPAACSYDGRVVVGSASGTSGYWTGSTGTVIYGHDTGFSQVNEGYAVSGNGAVLVGLNTPPGGRPDNAYRWTGPGTYDSIGRLDQYNVTRISGADFTGNTLVGYSETFQSNTAQAWVWTRGTGLRGIGYTRGGAARYSQALGVTADGSTVVGFSGGQLYTDAFAWTASGGMTRLPTLANEPTSDYEALGVSPSGQYIVGAVFSNSRTLGCLWTDRHAVALTTPPGYDDVMLTSVSDNGIVVGKAVAGTAVAEAFVWAPGEGPTPMADYLRRCGVSIPWSSPIVGACGVAGDGSTFYGSILGVGSFAATIPSPGGLVAFAGVIAAPRRARPGLRPSR